jgi:FkbM family methyltransferase
MADDYLIDWLWRYFRPGSLQGYLVDVGAADGVYGSLSRRLLVEAGWSGTLIEPLPEFYTKLKELYRGNDKVHLINAAASDEEGIGLLHPFQAVSTLEPKWAKRCAQEWSHVQYQEPIPVLRRKLLSILAEVRPPSPINLLTIDTEGHGLSVLRGMDWSRKVDVVVYETLDMEHPTEDNRHEPKPEVVALLAAQGLEYEFNTTGSNAVFVRQG